MLLASYQPIIQSGTILISANAGPHQIAGSQCAPNFFSASWQNDQTPEAMGKFMQDQNMDDVYLIAPDYAAGRDMMTGFKRYFKDKIAAETYTKFGQSDYQVEISQIRDANPKAVFAFLPGGMGIQFVKQYAQAGLREKIPLYSAFTVDETTLPAIGDAAAGNYEVGFWSPDLDNAAQQGVRRRVPQEIRLLPIILRGAELRRDRDDRSCRQGGERRSREKART